jgi:uncharacterized protein YjbJ (UPF0337 family)
MPQIGMVPGNTGEATRNKITMIEGKVDEDKGMICICLESAFLK